MTPANKKSFTALLEPDGTELRWVVARVPFDIAKAWPERKGRRVRGTIGDLAFRTSLFSDSRRDCHVLLVNKKMQAASGARVGSKVRITLEPDLEERPVEIPTELTRLMRTERGLTKWFNELNPSRRREIGKWVAEPKTAESREKRATKIAERMLQAMEGESDPPPVLRAAFERQPLARAGWAALTPTQRRNHLLGIFYYETAEARERRAAKAIDEALRCARKRNLGKNSGAVTE